jgi:hypothetical protein
VNINRIIREGREREVTEVKNKDEVVAGRRKTKI